MWLQEYIPFCIDKRETNGRNCVCWEQSLAGLGRLHGSVFSAQLTFFIKPHCIIMAGVSGILHCCLISQLMLLLGAANPSFVLLKEPLSFHYHREIEFVIYRKRICSSYIRRLLNLNKLQFLLLQCVDGLWWRYLHSESLECHITVRGLENAKKKVKIVLNRFVKQKQQSPTSLLWHFICVFR